MAGQTGRRAGRVGARRQLAFFYAMAALALVVVSIVAVLATRWVARAQALQNAEQTTERLASLVISPLLRAELAGDPQARRQLDDAIRNRMADGYLTEVTIWAADGTVLYANETDEIGQQLDTPAEVTAAIENGTVSSAFEDQPEATGEQFPAGTPGFVEVYVPLDAPGLNMLAFEAYYDYARVDESASALLWQLVPLVLAPLLIMQLIQSPIPFSLARRVRRHEEERSSLLERALSISDRERVRFAADLHDGPIQDLAGVSYVLDALSQSVPEAHRPLMGEAQATVRHAIDSLRRLMIDLYPPDLSSDHLATTIENLAAPLRDSGIEVGVAVAEIPELDTDSVTTLYRVAREALANVGEHAQASQVQVALGMLDGDAGGSVVLEITDDGIGIDISKLDRRSEGHLGLLLLIDRVAHLGGSLTLTPSPGGGTTVRAELPIVGTRSRIGNATTTDSGRRPAVDLY